MKGKLAFIILIAVLAVTAVSAEDNQTQIAHDTNVTFEEKMWAENLTDIQVDLPENANGNLSVKINNQTIYNNYTQNKSVKVPITLPQDPKLIAIPGWPPESKTYNVQAYYNDIEITTKSLTVMNHNKTHDYFFTPHEVLHNGEYEYQSLIFPSTSQGYIDVYIDGSFYKRIKTSRWTFIDGISGLNIGTHEMRIEYTGDDYFLPTNKTYHFNVSDVTISLSDTLILDHDDCLSVNVVRGAKCSVEIYVDGKLFKRGSVDKYGDYIFSFFDLKCTTHDIEVRVTGDFSRTLKKTVNVTYYIDASPQRFTYGDENIFTISLPEDLKKNLLYIIIGGTRFQPSVIGSSYADVDVSGLKKGNYTVYIEYVGDEKYYRYSTTTYLVVDYDIEAPTYITYNDGEEISLTLPRDAAGNLVVLINNAVYKSVKLSKGKASIAVSRLAPGKYSLVSYYSGSDYEVESVNSTLTVDPDMYYPCNMDVGDDEYIGIYCPKNTRGYVIFKYNNKQVRVNIKNGVAKLDLSNFKVGDYEFDIVYVDLKGYTTTLWADIYVSYTTPKIKASNADAYVGEKNKYTFKLIKRNGSPIKNRYVTVKIAKKTYKVKTNSRGMASIYLPKLKIGTYKIYLKSGKLKTTKRIHVRHFIALKTVKVKKSDKKLVLFASLKKPLKAKIITFKFNGKTYKAKTDKSGVAKVTVKKSVLKKLKVAGKVTYSASYKNDIVKKTAKVKG